jgi:hypothetical protein
MRQRLGRGLRGCASVVLALAWGGGPVVAQPAGGGAGHGAQAHDMAVVGSHDLQERSAYQPVIHRHPDGQWIAYVGHHGGTEAVPIPLNPLTRRPEDNGTSILDVTDPRNPRYLAHVPGEPGLGETGGAQMVRVCDGKTLPRADRDRVYLLRTFGNSAHEVWDVTDPASPRRVAFLSGLKGTHKNWWECDTGIAYLVSGVDGWRTRRMTQIYDLGDPTKPVFIRNFGLPGQEPGASGPAPTELHGPISTGPAGNRVYFGYGTNKNGVLQIVDRQKLLTGPAEPTPANLLLPQVSRLDLSPWGGAHTVLPVRGVDVAEFAKDAEGRRRDFVVVVNESLVNECAEARQMVWIVDVTNEKTPFGVSSYTVREAEGGFCARGGRFGSHSAHEHVTPIFHGRLVFVAWFNAGVRAIDIRDPFSPREVAFYIPATTASTDKRCVKVGGVDRCKVAIQTNNVEVDDRGYVYIVDRANTGLHILELTGPARQVANFP